MLTQLKPLVQSHPELLVAAVALGLLSAAFYLYQKYHTKDFKAPNIADEFSGPQPAQIHELIQEGYKKYGSESTYYKIPQVHADTVILPINKLDELKSLPDSKLSAMEDQDERFLPHYSLGSVSAVGGNVEVGRASVKRDLTRNLQKLEPDVNEEIEIAFSKLMPTCEDWTEVEIMSKIFKIVALAVGRVFVGNPLNRDPEYIRTTMSFTKDTFTAMGAIRAYHPLLRPFAQYFLKEIQNVNTALETMKRLVKPVLEKNMACYEDKSTTPSLSVFNLRNAPDAKYRANLDIHAHTLLVLSLAALHTTSTVTTNAIYDLAERPWYAEPLRAEAAAAKEEAGDLVEVPEIGDEELKPTKASVARMKKLDSFLKEGQRIHPILIIHFRRKAMQDIVLKDGTLIPAGTHVAIATDPTPWEDVDSFDGFRWSKLREQPGQDTKHHFVATGPDSLSFGHGSHACPGRHYAVEQVKLIIMHLIENYELKFRDEDQVKPKRIKSAGGYMPNPQIKVLLKKRQVAPLVDRKDSVIASIG
ncbi:cytochrome P450 [Pseudovirgaria hyperparasitica]|uniref:Cytochrome P450 n=1 Tax=Pseudovirgaria hyperparasitica TaxID=470096 RepID=A0A6A6WAK3_9PEZI|nr:cytochrome P450 [Pseudovirgaria hyperparasitica]KAF2758980.1 cytochrome P450 [Pseudovirgaria hyperparasitica]